MMFLDYGMKKVSNMILLLHLVLGQILDFPGVTYVDNCYPYECNLQGICTNLTGNTYICDCYTYYDGDNCETTLLTCNDVDCGDYGTCLYEDADPTCFCEYGWEREDADVLTSACSVEKSTTIPCDIYDCGGNGECYMLAGEAMCKCDAGWGGDSCSWQNQDISNMFLLEMAALLIDEYPDQAENIAYDCSYLWPFVWDEAPMAKEIGDYSDGVAAPCNCISAIRDVAFYNSWDTLYQWRLDSKYSLNVEELHELHCPYDVTVDDVKKFTDVISAFSSDCATVLSGDNGLPLYLRNQMTCSCLDSVAEYVDDPEEFLKYPLDLTRPFSTAYMNYQACTEGVCDYEEIYAMIMEKSVDYPRVAETCAPIVMRMAKSYDDDEYKEDICACFVQISTYCTECGEEWFSCLASSWDWLTVEDRFRELCFHSTKIWREYAWKMNYYAMLLVTVDIVGASSCSNVVMTAVARAQVPMGIDGKVNQTLCDCMSSLALNGFDSAWDEIMDLAPTGFSLDESECEGYVFTEVVNATSDTSTSTVTTQIVIMVTLCVLISLNAILLFRNIRKRKSYKTLDDSKDAKPEAVNYKTTES